MNESEFIELVADTDEKLRGRTDIDAPRIERVEKIVKYVEEEYPDAVEGIDTNPVRITSQITRQLQNVTKSSDREFTERFVADATRGESGPVRKRARENEREAFREQYQKRFDIPDEKFESLSTGLGEMVRNADGDTGMRLTESDGNPNELQGTE